MDFVELAVHVGVDNVVGDLHGRAVARPASADYAGVQYLETAPFEVLGAALADQVKAYLRGAVLPYEPFGRAQELRVETSAKAPVGCVKHEPDLRAAPVFKEGMAVRGGVGRRG